jgi:hypothetical protein
LRADVPGLFTFALTVRGEAETTCTASASVLVHSDVGIYIQLIWHTPGDVNENDTGVDQDFFSVGSDVDLHLLHPLASAYFESRYDCYWDNTAPEWGFSGPAGDPKLDRDDSDGAGPELASLLEPEADATYSIGVHYWNDWGYGKSLATVRVFVKGTLAAEFADVELVNDDMWDCCTIDENGNVAPIGVQPKITPNYRGLSP